MKYEILDNKNLKLILDEGDKEALGTVLESSTNTDHGFLADLLEFTGWSTNDIMYPTTANQVGGLTDAPMITDELEIDDTGTVARLGRLWYYASYQLASFAEELLETGSVVFKYYNPVRGDIPLSK